MNSSRLPERPAVRSRRGSEGFTLVEVLIVIVILGIVATVVVFSVRAIVDRGEDAACRTEERILTETVEAYLGENTTVTIPATGPITDPERFERTLIDSGRLGEFSRLYQVNADGTLTITDDSCL